MNETFCNVALAVPLRTTFTYAVPEPLRAAVQPGVRVLVPFRKRSLVGVVVDLPERAPEKAKIREISKVLDVIPALTPTLIELGHWIAGYYLAPAGEVFRAMLPPVTELRTQQQITITAAGRQFVDSTSSTLGAEFDAGEIALLSKLIAKNGILPASTLEKSGVSSAVLQRLARRGLVEIRQSLLARKQKTQTILAWRTEDSETRKRARILREKIGSVRCKEKHWRNSRNKLREYENCWKPNAGRCRCRKC
jgi:primosomal protein N' (replication factor Y)